MLSLEGDLPAWPVPPQYRDHVELPAARGHEKFQRLGLDRSTIATWLDDAGYDTAYFGKYMNGYDDTTYVPPDWDRWFGWLGNYDGSGGEYRLNENGRIESYDRDRIHDTDLLREGAIHFIRDQQGDGRSFFMYLAPNAPHALAYVAERHEGMFTDRSLPKPPSFNEENISDKPEVVRRPELGHGEVEELGDVYRKRLAALQSVDGMIEALIQTLRDAGQLDSTYIMFTLTTASSSENIAASPGKEVPRLRGVHKGRVYRARTRHGGAKNKPSGDQQRLRPHRGTASRDHVPEFCGRQVLRTALTQRATGRAGMADRLSG